MQNRSVRMGHSRRGGSLLPWIAAGVAGIAVVIGIVLFSLKEAPNKMREGCLGDGDCREGYICADGGCILLLSEEIPAMWHEGINTQLDPEKGAFTPASAYGVDLPETRNCPAKEIERFEKKRQGAIELLEDITVYILGIDHMRILKKKKVESSMWLDRMTLIFQKTGVGGKPVFCTGHDIDAIKIRENKVEYRVDALLSQSVPASSPAVAGVMERRFLSDREKKEGVELSFACRPARERGTREKSVVAIPLGTEVISIQGMRPAKQRLITGYITYHFKHGKRSQNISVKLKLPQKLRNELHLEELKP